MDDTAIAVEIEYARRVNYALVQQGIAIVETVRLTNQTDGRIESIEVSLRFANGECELWETKIEAIGPGETYTLSPSLHMDVQALATRTERERTTMELTVRSAAGVFVKHYEVMLLPLEAWSGLSPVPELIGAFVLPNHPAVAGLLQAARERLKALGEDEAIDGYQSNSRRRAALLAQVCYEALAGQSLGYINPPAGFEETGQRVRLVDRVLTEKQGTCLDLALVLAAVCEQAGLHGVLLFFEDHVVYGLWTRNDRFASGYVDEIELIRNRIGLGDLVPIETTMVTRAGASFADAVSAATRRLEKGTGWVGAVDLASARAMGFSPLPLRVKDDGVSVIATDGADATDAVHKTTGKAAVLEAVELAQRDQAAAGGETIREDDVPARVERWKRKLLDLSLRNRLLNFRPTSKTLELDCPDLGELEDRLASGERFAIKPQMPERPLAAASEQSDGMGESPGKQAFLAQELKAGRLYAAMDEQSTARRLLGMYRAAKLQLEETGANVLYLALGMLCWYESPTAERCRLAPLLMVPVRLVRKSGSGGYRYEMEIGSEPTRINITLVQKLHSEFGIDVSSLDELPEDEQGIDVALVLRRFREAIVSMPRWEVLQGAHLGLFSFSKFLMWRDLEVHTEALKKNPVVAHLIEPSRGVLDQQAMPSPVHIDRDHAEVLCTRDADSSQLVAVAAAGQGRTFVLEGPPGTGKSQTIANIVANSLAHGLRVLFVAEKMAALSVVRHRLERDGLGAFCLELHGAKASKKEVLRQLGESLDASGMTESPIFAQTREARDAARDELDAYVEALHAPQPSGETIYAMIGRLAQLGHRADEQRIEPVEIVPDRKHFAQTSSDELARWRSVLSEMVQAGRAVEPVHEHSLRGIAQADWSFGLPVKAKDAIEKAGSTLAALVGSLVSVCQTLGLEAADARQFEYKRCEALVSMIGQVAQHPVVERALLESADVPGTIEQLRELIDRDEQLCMRRDALLARYEPELLEADLPGLLAGAKLAKDKPGIVRWWFVRKINKALLGYVKTRPEPIGKMVDDLHEAMEVARELKALDARRAVLVRFLGSDWAEPMDQRGPDVHTTGRAVLAWVERSAPLLQRLASDARGRAVAQALVALVTKAGDDQQAASCRRLVNSWQQWCAARQHLVEVLDGSLHASVADDQAYLSAAQRVLTRWLEGLGQLNDWCRWNRACRAANQAGLSQAVAMVCDGRVRLDQLVDAFERGYGRRWLNEVADQTPAIARFNPSEHDQTVETFAGLDTKVVQLTRSLVAARLAQRVPAGMSAVSSASEVGVLRRELAKQRRHMPLRQLFKRLPHLLPRLKPCFLMSPLSVAQYLDANDGDVFDLVIFDEASQIPVWDAIGSIARGRSLIVVGDSKQLPPTSFFHVVEDEEQVDEASLVVEEELESILQESCACGLPSLGLSWHYRSRHESLITFSNHFYYDDMLQTFPSPVSHNADLGVSFRYVENGVYDRGNTRTNRREARAVVDEVVTRLQRYVAREGESGYRAKSIGIVTFNANQQQLIEDMLDEVRQKHPEFERYFTTVEEPIFVKNLENVQGDERDVMLFSVGYGPDETGRMSMNFGPLNGQGGQRRLNVAITRARYALVVFASMKPEAIDLSRTRALGVRHFKRYLEYAARGPASIGEAIARNHQLCEDTGLVDAIAQVLTSRGWSVKKHVGQGNYRVDLAVVDPDDPDRFVLGIECDGPMYARANIARDRDRTRPAMMTHLGWNLVRVWSVAWQLDSRACIERIEHLLRGEHDATSVTAAQVSNAIQQAAEQKASSLSCEGSSKPERTVGEQGGLRMYRCATRLRGVRSSTDLYALRNTDLAVRALGEIVAQEGPIVPDLASRRLADWFGISRRTERYRARFEEILGRAALAGLVMARGDAFFAADAVHPEQLSDVAERYRACLALLRVPGHDEQSQRDIDEIAQIECVAAMLWVLTEQVGLPVEALIKEAGRVLGATRLGEHSRVRLREALDAGVALGVIEVDQTSQSVGLVEGVV